MNDDWAVTAMVSVIALVFLGLCVLVGVTTHNTSNKKQEYHNQQLLACINQTDRTAADCRVIVFGGAPN